jgi:hypothetical protein
MDVLQQFGHFPHEVLLAVTEYTSTPTAAPEANYITLLNNMANSLGMRHTRECLRSEHPLGNNTDFDIGRGDPSDTIETKLGPVRATPSSNLFNMPKPKDVINATGPDTIQLLPTLPL